VGRMLNSGQVQNFTVLQMSVSESIASVSVSQRDILEASWKMTIKDTLTKEYTWARGFINSTQLNSTENYGCRQWCIGGYTPYTNLRVIFDSVYSPQWS